MSDKVVSPGVLQDQVALVIGAADGIGQGIAVELGREGAIVVLTDDPRVSHEVTAGMIEDLGGRSWICALSYQPDPGLSQVVEAVLERYHLIDLVVHGPCSRVVTSQGLAGISREQGEDVIRENLIDPLFFTQRVIQEMRLRQTAGLIIFLAPMAYHFGGLSLDPVSESTSAALLALTRSLALEVAPSSIRVNAIAFGAITAPNGPAPSPDKLVPLGYRITAADIGAGVVFLASSKARFITGTSLVIDGGLGLVSGSYLRSQRLIDL